ncbi:hypothetical protein FB45DRAFT_179337 [Roridomyces roridus]|uniref:F-box domain-containing protein n=1 Tax=Roridomyces roridus TaxID=1738132 RepID=A0AAD7CDY3_9AGAR|nr:hypothetical protein FB45DRAFT_179337 [Roridomyces roridus]
MLHHMRACRHQPRSSLQDLSFFPRPGPTDHVSQRGSAGLLRDCNMRLVKSWCLAITRKQHLADRVWALILELPNPLEPKEAELLSGAFARCANLKRLAVHHIPGSTPENNKQSCIVEGPFHLNHLFNTYFCLVYGTFTFFHQQNHIRVLSLPSAALDTTFVDSQLPPDLIAIDAPLDVVCRLSEAETGRPLERVQIHYDRYYWAPDLSSLSRFAPTLKALTVVEEGSIGGSETVDVVEEVLEALPQLQHLGIYEKEQLESDILENSIVPRLRQFTSLTTFTLRLRRRVRILMRGQACFLHHRTHLLHFGYTMLGACATLRKATIAVEVPGEEEVTCTFTKEGDGSVSTTFDDELEEDSFYAMIFD